MSVYRFLLSNCCICLSLFSADTDKSAESLLNSRGSISNVVNPVGPQQEASLSELVSNIDTQPQSGTTEADLLPLSEDDCWEVVLLGTVIAATFDSFK